MEDILWIPLLPFTAIMDTTDLDTALALVKFLATGINQLHPATKVFCRTGVLNCLTLTQSIEIGSCLCWFSGIKVKRF